MVGAGGGGGGGGAGGGGGGGSLALKIKQRTILTSVPVSRQAKVAITDDVTAGGHESVEIG